MATALIMAGGFGKRLWPQSTLSQPKQFMCIAGSASLLQLTYKRCTHCFGQGNVFVITRRALRDTVMQHLPSLFPEQIITEPVGRDTAPCIGYAALCISHLKGEEPIHVLPADHLLGDGKELIQVMRAATEAARKGYLVTIGIKPTRPETGYGYLQMGEQIHDLEGAPCHRLARFTEKPSYKKAKAFVESENFLWNAGIFAWMPQTILDEIRTHVPLLHQGLEEIRRSLGTKQQGETVNRVYPQLPRTSIDYAVMEKTTRAVAIPAAFAWDDIGDWQALERVYSCDEDGNISRGLTLGMDTENCTLINSEKKPLAVLGVSNLTIVNTPAGLLVVSKELTSRVKDIVDRLLQDPRTREYVE